MKNSFNKYKTICIVCFLVLTVILTLLFKDDVDALKIITFVFVIGMAYAFAFMTGIDHAINWFKSNSDNLFWIESKSDLPKDDVEVIGYSKEWVSRFNPNGTAACFRHNDLWVISISDICEYVSVDSEELNAPSHWIEKPKFEE